jgi:hypothetical protein
VEETMGGNRGHYSKGVLQETISTVGRRTSLQLNIWRRQVHANTCYVVRSSAVLSMLLGSMRADETAVRLHAWSRELALGNRSIERNGGIG